MLSWILMRAGTTVALATTQGAYVDGDALREGDSAGCKQASRLLLDPRTEAVVFELARGGLISTGMAFDGCDVAAVLNIYDNHLGLDGIDSREQMAAVKGLVARAARRLAVLNADDALCLAMCKDIQAQRICLVSEHDDNPALVSQLAAGGLAAYLDTTAAPMIRLCEGSVCLGEIPAAEIPSSFGGAFRPALVNAMFAMALAHGLGVGVGVIREALADFVSDESSNPGRMNFIEGLPFRLLATHADGPQAVGELAAFVSRLDGFARKILMFCCAGNRSDEFMIETGRAVAGAFDQYVCSDTCALRGRMPLEVAKLLARGLREGGTHDADIRIAPDHDEALRMAFALAEAGDLLVVKSIRANRIHELGLVEARRTDATAAKD